MASEGSLASEGALAVYRLSIKRLLREMGPELLEDYLAVGGVRWGEEAGGV